MRSNDISGAIPSLATLPSSNPQFHPLLTKKRKKIHPKISLTSLKGDRFLFSFTVVRSPLPSMLVTECIYVNKYMDYQ